ncbi:MAG TPA: PAS domain S-box protein, partial [Terriglobia bacterium]|nr:PAS domain S-box protein [Terriglobia bacterium]
MPKPHRKKTPTESIAKLKARLAEAEETLRAIREGEVDAVVVSGPRGEQVYSLAGAESIYRLIVDTMKEAAFTLAFDGTILYSNARFGEFVRKPLDQIVGHRLAEFVRADEQEAVKKFLERGRRQPLRQRLVFTASDSAHVSAHISSNLMDAPHGPSICVVATDLTELENSTELIAKLREQQAALAESEGRYETLVAHAPDAIVVHQDERIVYANTAALRLYGAASFADLRERNIIDLVDQNDRGAVRIRAHLVRGGRTTPLRESRILRLDGQAVPVEATAGTIEYQGKPAVQVILRDISERKRLAADLEIAARLPQENPNPVMRLSQGRFLDYANAGAGDLLKIWGCALGQEVPGEIADPAVAALHAGAYRDVESTFAGRTYLFGLAPIPQAGYVNLYARDITDRKRAEEGLRASEERLRLATEAARIGAFEWNIQTGANTWTPELEAMYGLAPGEFGKTQTAWEQLVHPEDRAAARGAVNRAFETGEPVEGEWRVVWPDGRVHWILGCFQAFKDAAGTPLRLAGVNIDITARKRAEIDLRAREQRLRLAADAAQLGIFEWTVPTDTAVWENQRMYEIFGIPESLDPVNRDQFVRETLHPEDLPRFERELEESMRPGALFRGAYRIRRLNDKQLRWIQYFAKFELTPDGKPLRLLGVLQDITARKQAEEVLRENEARLAREKTFSDRIINSLPGIFYLFDENGKFLRWNQNNERVTGCSSQELAGMKMTDFIDLKEKDLVLRRMNDLFADGAAEVEADLIAKDGTRTPYWFTGTRLILEGKPHLLGFAFDISERKRAEEALRASEARFRVLAEAMPQIVWSADATGAVDYLNPQAFQFAGVRMEDAAGWNWRSFVHPDDLAHTEAGWRRTLATGEEDQIEHRLRRADGEYRWHLTRGGPVRNEKGKVIRWIGTATDIHDQKMVEQTLERLVAERTAELAHSKAQLETVTANAPIILFATDAQGVFTVHTGKAIAATGRKPGDLVGKHYLSFLPEWPEAVECIRRALAGESFTTVLAVPTGSTFEALYTPLLDTEGKSAGMIAVAVDVTERAKAESALRETQALTNAIVDSTTDLIWSVDPEHFGLMTFNVGLRNHFLRLGVRLQEGKRPEDCFADPALAAHWRGIYQRALKEGTFTLDHESATAGYMVVTANLLRRDGKVFGISVFGKDITERKRAQEALEKERHRLYDVLETLPAMICLLTADYHVAFANRAFRERFGESKGRRCYENCFGRSAPCEFCESYEVFKTNRPHHWEVRSPDGSVIDAYDYPFTDVDGTPMILEMDIDITARKRMEEQLHRLNRALRTLSAANEVVVRAGNELEVVQGVCKILAEVGGYRFVWVGYPQPDTAKSVRPVAYAGAGEAYLQGVKITWADDAWGRGPTGTAIRTGQPAINRHTEENATVSPWREEQSRHGFACSIALPLQAGSQVFGALSLYAAEPDAFNEDEVKLLTELAADLSFGIDAIRTRAAREGAAEALQESETRYKNFISHSIEGVWRVELANPLPLGLPESESLEWLLHHGIMAECNAAFARIAGFTSPDELVGRRMAEVIFPWDEGRMEAFRSMVHEGFQSRSVEIRTLDSESRRRDLVRTEIPIVENGCLVRVWGITRDVTDLKRAEAAVQKAFAEIRDLY